MKVIKVNNARLADYGEALSLGNFHNSTKEPYPLGKVCISVPYKKGRRRLIKGTIDANPESVIYSGLWWEYVFTPSSVVQVAKIRELFPK